MPLPDDWRVTAAQWLRSWDVLDEGERTRLEQHAGLVLAKRWEPSAGFALTDEMKVAVAVNAALLYLRLDEEPFANVASIVIHPTTIVLRGERPGPSPGVMTDAPLPTLGHTSWRGPVFLAWDAVERDLGAPAGGTNVILHEFAHKLDAFDGTVDGTPRLADGARLHEWVEVCTAELAALRSGVRSPVLRAYAATSPGEFFAVATEGFFEQPQPLREAHGDLYRVFADFYRQDPAARVASDGPTTGSFSTNTGWP